MPNNKLIDCILTDMLCNNDEWSNVKHCSLNEKDLNRKVLYDIELNGSEEPVEYIIYTDKYIYFMTECGEDMDGIGGIRYKRCSINRDPVIGFGVRLHGYLTGNRLEE
jgi:hypothetical protein